MSDSASSSPRTWVIVSGIDNFRASRELGFTVQGMKSRHRKKAERMRPGDRLVYYVTGIKAFGGIVEVTGPSFESHEPIWKSKDPKKDAEDYPWRVPVRPETILDEGDFIPAEPLARQMAYVGRYPAANWTLAFQGNVHELPAADGELVLTAVREAVGVPSGAD